MVPLSRVKAIRIRTRRVLLGRIEPWERIYRAITFFGQIFQPFHNYSSLRPLPRKLGQAACWFFHHPIHNKSNETWRKRKRSSRSHFAEELARPHGAVRRRSTSVNEQSLVFLFLKTPNPLSLAATNGVSVDFPSFSYSDVSVR